MNTVKISKADHIDLPDILRIQHQAYRTEAELYGDYLIPPLQESLANIKESLTRCIILKAEVDGILAGSVRATLNGDVCEIGRLSVAPEYQKRGIGRTLLLACETLFSEARCCELFTGSKSQANLRLYEKTGYKRTSKQIQSPSVILIYLRKTI